MTDALCIDGPIGAFYIDDRGLRSRARSLALEFRTLAKELDAHATKANLTSITGTVVGIAGTVVSVIGIVALPFTGGASAVVAAVGGGIAGAAGGLTAGGAKIALKIIEKLSMKDVPEKWSTFGKDVRNALGRELGNLPRLEREWEEETDWEKQFRDESVLLIIHLGLMEIIAKSFDLYKLTKSQAGDILRGMAKILDNFAQTGMIQ